MNDIREYILPGDCGQRYMAEPLTSSVFDDNEWGIIDRNSFVLLRTRRHGGSPDPKGLFVWRGSQQQALEWCDILNKREIPAAVDVGTGPELPARIVDIGVLLAQRRSRKPVEIRHVLCGDCGRWHAPGCCPS